MKNFPSFIIHNIILNWIWLLFSKITNGSIKTLEKTQLGYQKLIIEKFGSLQEERESKTKLVVLGQIRNLI